MKLFKRYKRKISLPQVPRRVAKIDWGSLPDEQQCKTIENESSHTEIHGNKVQTDNLSSNSLKNKDSLLNVPYKRVHPIEYLKKILQPADFLSNLFGEENIHLEVSDSIAPSVEIKAAPKKTDDSFSKSVDNVISHLEIIDAELILLESKSEILLLDKVQTGPVNSEIAHLEIIETKTQTLESKDESIQTENLQSPSVDSEITHSKVIEARLHLHKNINEKLSNEIKLIYKLWTMTTREVQRTKKIIDIKREELDNYDVKLKVNGQLNDINFKDT